MGESSPEEGLGVTSKATAARSEQKNLQCEHQRHLKKTQPGAEDLANVELTFRDEGSQKRHIYGL